MIKTFYFLASVLWGGFFMSNAQAQQLVCSKENPALKLNNIYGEEVFAVMLNHAGAIKILYVNPKAKTWSMVIHIPDKKLFCFAANGTNFMYKKKGVPL